MIIYVTNETEREMLNDFMVHVKHDLESVMDLYWFDKEAADEITDVTRSVDVLIDSIIVDDTIKLDIKDIVDRMMAKGMTNAEISELTGLDVLTVKRCRMRQKQ